MDQPTQELQLGAVAATRKRHACGVAVEHGSCLHEDLVVGMLSWL
jgi:hypothetical protein